MHSRIERKIYYVLWLVCVAIYGLTELRLIDDVVAWPVLGSVLLVQLWLWSRTRMRYLDYVLDPLRPEQLPRETYQHFDRWTPEFMALGCGLVGDFQLSYRPWPTYVRYFLPPDPRIKGEVSQADEAVAPSFTTIFDDGRLLETARFEQSHTKVGEELKIWAQCVADVSIAELYALHRRQIDLYESTYGARPLTVTRDRLLDFAQYGHRLVWWQRNKLPARFGTPQPPVGDNLFVAGAQAARG